MIYLIEYGFAQSGDSGYDYWKRPKPRRFLAETKKRLSESGAHVEALKKGLTRQGVRLK